MKDNFEIVLDDLRLHPDSRISAIINRLTIGKSSIKYALYRLVQMGMIKKCKYGPSDFGYSEIEGAEIPTHYIPGYLKEKIRFAARFSAFQDAVVPMIKDMPGRTSFFYAELLGQGTQTTVNGLKKLEKKGIIIQDKRRRKNMKNPLSLWWISGEQPDDFENYQPTEDIMDRPTILEPPIKAMAVEPIDDDDLKWMNEARRTRHQRISSLARQYENQPPIPSYADYFRANGG